MKTIEVIFTLEEHRSIYKCLHALIAMIDVNIEKNITLRDKHEKNGKYHCAIACVKEIDKLLLQKDEIYSLMEKFI